MSDAGRPTHRFRWRSVEAFLQLIAAPPLAVACLIAVGVVLAAAHWLELRHGREWVDWMIYDGVWFGGLLSLTLCSVAASLFRSLPRRWRHVGHWLVYGGFLVLVAGVGWSLYGGATGELVLGERQSVDRAADRQRTEITVERVSTSHRSVSRFSFAPGVKDWPAGKSLEFAEADGLALRVVTFLRHAQPQVDWVAAEHDPEVAALRLLVVDPFHAEPTEEWLTASAYGGDLFVGATRFVLWPLYLDTMVADFLDPPTDLGTAGVLSVHYQNQMHRLRIDDVRGQTVPLGDSGAAVEVVDYYPDAKPQPDGRKFMSRSNRPQNPVLELRVHLPNDPEPMRQLAFAKSPLLNLDGVLGRACPVRFWYHHADVPQQAGVVFAQTPAGKLYARPVANGKLTEPREVRVNDSLQVEGPAKVTIMRHLSQARRQVTFTPLEPSADPADSSEAAVQVELSVDGTQRTIWLSRGDNEYAFQTLLTSAGLASVTCGYHQLALGCQVGLQELQSSSPAVDGKNVVDACVVNVRDTAGQRADSHTVAYNQPLALGAYRLCLTGVRDLSQGQSAAVFVVSRDPGRFVRYVGCVLLACGLVWMGLARVSSFRS